MDKLMNVASIYSGENKDVVKSEVNFGYISGEGEEILCGGAVVNLDDNGRTAQLSLADAISWCVQMIEGDWYEDDNAVLCCKIGNILVKDTSGNNVSHYIENLMDAKFRELYESARKIMLETHDKDKDMGALLNASNTALTT